MRRSRKSHLSMILALTFVLEAAAAEPIAWSLDRPLTWNDFAGKIPAGARQREAAMTAASLSWKFAYEIEQSADSCRYWITDVTAAAAFYPDMSWSKPSQRTERVLTHEQAHFDITQIFKLMFDAVSWQALGTTRECPTDRMSAVETRVTAEIEETLGALHEKIWDAHVELQRKYDAETEHGLDEEVQQRWLERVDAGLRGKDWDELGYPFE